MKKHLYEISLWYDKACVDLHITGIKIAAIAIIIYVRLITFNNKCSDIFY